jgi:hypothetical protein
MRRVERSEVLALGAYEQIRPHFRERVIALKSRRRLELGEHMSLVFENHDTVLLQIQEMLRTERISDERAVVHELDTYNDLVPPEGGLSATLFIEYDDKEERTRMLAAFATLRERVHLRVGDRRITAHFATQHGEEMDRIPAVNYLSFTPGIEAAAMLRNGAIECAIEVDHPDYPLRAPLPSALREELARDLADPRLA